MKIIPSEVQTGGIYYTEHDGKKCLILQASWDKDDANTPIETLRCSFCGNTHKHGKTEGHRIAHCALPYGETYSCIADDGTVLYSRDGYVLQNLRKKLSV